MKNKQICNPFLAFYKNGQILKMKKILDDQHAIEEENLKLRGTKRVMVDPSHIAKIRKA